MTPLGKNLPPINPCLIQAITPLVSAADACSAGCMAIAATALWGAAGRGQQAGASSQRSLGSVTCVAASTCRLRGTSASALRSAVSELETQPVG